MSSAKKSYWEGQGDRGYSLTTVIDQGGVPHGRKWQSGDLKIGDVGLSLRLDTRNQPTLTEAQKAVLIEQVDNFCNLAKQNLGQQPVQKFAFATGDFVGPVEDRQLAWIGKIIRVDHAGVLLRKLSEEVNYFDLFDKAIEEAEIQFIPWSQFKVRLLGQAIPEVLRKSIGENKEYGLSQLFEKNEIITYLLEYTTADFFSLDMIDGQEFQSFIFYGNYSGGTNYQEAEKSYYHGLAKAIQNYSYYIWENLSDLADNALSSLFSGDSAVNCCLDVPYEVGYGNTLIHVGFIGFSEDEVKKAVESIFAILEKGEDSDDGDHLLFHHPASSGIGIGSTLYRLIANIPAVWINNKVSQVEQSIRTGLVSPLYKTRKHFTDFLRNKTEDEAELQRLLKDFSECLRRDLAKIDKNMLWQAFVAALQKYNHPLAEKASQYKPE